MELLRIVTAGSVDDGKSTLIGRLLYETKSLKDDQLEHIVEKSKSKGIDYIDFSLATDGLLTEREQGITIDISNIFFKTDQRRFVIADAPGHVEYTRNMVTGASNADTAIILIDARKGVLEQTQRHYNITQLLGINHLIFVINKMDLIDYNHEKFKSIKEDILQLT
ncbi:MAG: GTP-binding protein, partial [Candidatus Arcticimaribacter sp.]